MALTQFRSTRAARLVGASAVLALLLTGCGSDKKSNAAATPQAPSPTPSPTPSARALTGTVNAVDQRGTGPSGAAKSVDS